MTVLEVIQRSTDFLARKGVEAPRLQIELLLAHLLEMPRLKLYLSFERTLADAELATLRELVRRRGNREPLQHLIGTVSFCGYELRVSPDVLIPRPETELLAEQAWRWLAERPGQSPAALDLGTGSGCLAVALAAHCATARITAVDLSEAALALARSNAAQHRVGDRVVFLPGDWFAPLPPASRFDLIVSNPPYVPTDEIQRLEPEVRDHDPRLALDGGADGLDCIRRLAREAAPFLAVEGRLMFEFGDGQAEAADQVMRSAGWVVEQVTADYRGCPRILVARRP